MITTKETLTRGVGVCVGIGSVFGALIYAATTWLWQPLELAIAIGVGGYVVTSLFVKGYHLIKIKAKHVGVATRFGDKRTGKIYDEGDHWGFPGIAGAIPVDMRRRRIALKDKFLAAAADASDVGVDGFAFVQVKDTDGAKLTVEVDDLDGSVSKLLETCIRLFTTYVAEAKNATRIRDVLSDYLELDKRESDALTTEHARVKRKLDELKAFFVVGGIDSLMEKDAAGVFKDQLLEWGLTLDEVEIEEYDVPEVVKTAVLERATAQAKMEAVKIRNTARKEMVAELVATGVNPNTAMNAVDILLGLNVAKTVHEITITDLKEASDKLGGPITAVLAQWLNKQKKGG